MSAPPYKEQVASDTNQTIGGGVITHSTVGAAPYTKGVFDKGKLIAVGEGVKGSSSGLLGSNITPSDTVKYGAHDYAGGSGKGVFIEGYPVAHIESQTVSKDEVLNGSSQHPDYSKITYVATWNYKT